MNSKFTLICRILLGTILIVFGSNKFLNFIPLSEINNSPPFNSLEYILHLIGILELLIGIMLVIKKWNNLALILLAPISVNIILFHIFVHIPGISIALLVVTLNGILLYKHRKAYTPLFIN
ncbi:MAG: DoxX family membrane protein [Flavobacterium sp.]